MLHFLELDYDEYHSFDKLNTELKKKKKKEKRDEKEEKRDNSNKRHRDLLIIFLYLEWEAEGF